MADELTIVWKALADPTRRHILDLLRQRPHTTGELAAQFDMSRPAVIKHLGILVDAGLVLVRREGRMRWNKLNVVPLQAIYERWLRSYEQEWAGSILRLKRLAEHAAQGEDWMPFEGQAGQAGRVIIEQETVINAAPERVFDVLTRNTSEWYGAPYLHREGGVVRLEPEVGGRLYEEWDTGKGALLATVVIIDAPLELRLMGPLGMRGPVHGDIAFQLVADGATTRLQLVHHIVGDVDADTERAYSMGWEDLLGNRLRAIAEQGNGE